MDYLWFKSLHIIFVVTWFSGLFYIVRLFIYQTEAQDRSADEQAILTPQFQLMSGRLWKGITWPSAILTLIMGGSLLYMQPMYLTQHWMWLKLFFVLLLFVYHLGCHRIYIKLQLNQYKYTSIQLRIWNELATILLFAIVFLVIFKTTTHWIWGTFGLIAFAILLMMAIKIYQRIRSNKIDL